MAKHPNDHPGNLARDGGRGPKPATFGNVPTHRDMTTNVTHQGQKVTLAGITHTELMNAPDASGQTPMDPSVQGKRLSLPAVSFGQRSRTSDARDLAALGKAILDSAIVSGSTRLPTIK